MSFDSKWSQPKADTAGQQSAHRQLNQLAAAGGGGGEDGVGSSMQSAKELSDHNFTMGEELIAASLRHRDGSAVSVSEISKTVK